MADVENVSKEDEIQRLKKELEQTKRELELERKKKTEKSNQREELRKKKKQKEKARKEKLKKEGKYLTAIQKADKQRSQASLELLKQQSLIKIGGKEKEDSQNGDNVKSTQLANLVEGCELGDEEKNDKLAGKEQADDEESDEQSDEESDWESDEESDWESDEETDEPFDLNAHFKEWKRAAKNKETDKPFDPIACFGEWKKTAKNKEAVEQCMQSYERFLIARAYLSEELKPRPGYRVNSDGTALELDR